MRPRGGSAVTVAASLFIVAGALRAFASGGEIIIRVADQELALIANRKTAAHFPVSTSKFGTGDVRGSYRTPLGETFVARKSATICRLAR